MQHSVFNQNFNRSSLNQSMHGFSQIAQVKELTNQCMKQQIKITQLPDRRLQSGLSLLSFKASQLQSHQPFFIIFLTKYKQHQINIFIYNQTKLFQRTAVQNQKEIASRIRQNLNKLKFNPKNSNVFNDVQTKTQDLFKKLNTKCEQLANTQKNQMMAAQKLKSTNQYKELLEHQIQMNMFLQSLCQQVATLEEVVQQKNFQILPRIQKIEEMKHEIQQLQYSYQEATKNAANVKQHISLFISELESQLQLMTIQDQDSLNKFIEVATDMKKLQIQRKFMI